MRAEGRSAGTGAGAGDGEVDDGLGLKKSLEEIVSLAFEDDQGDEVTGAGFLVMADEFGGIFLEGNDGIFITGDEGGGDGFFTTVAYLRISFDNDDFIIGFVSILEFVSISAYNS